MNKESNKKVRIKVRLSEEENEKLKRCASACGLSQSSFIRQLCKGKAPKPQPKKEFWELLEALYNGYNESMAHRGQTKRHHCLCGKPRKDKSG